MQRVKVLRHTLTYRVLHWLIVVEGVVLVLTGMQLGGIWRIRIIPDTVFATHVVTGMAFAATAAFFAYYMVASGEYKWFGLRRIPKAVRYLIEEAKAWLGRGRVEENPVRYDVKRGTYIEKIVPTETIVWWVYVALGLTVIITGLSMIFPHHFTIVYEVAGTIAGIVGGGPYSIIRAIHRFATFLTVAVVILHVYASWVFKMIQSIIFGVREEPIAESASEDEGHSS